MNRLVPALALSLCASLAAGCTTTLSIRSMQPGVVHVGPTDHLVLVGGEGRRSAREFVAHDLARQTRVRGYFSFEDRSDEGLSVRIAGRSASVEGGTLHLEPTHAGLRVDVLEWNTFRDEDQVEYTDKEGNKRYRQVPVQRGNVLLAITLFDHEGHAFLGEAEYEGWSTTQLDSPRETALELAATDALHGFLGDVTPVQVVTRVRLDDEDENQERFIDAAKSGAVAQAAHDLRGYVEHNPNSASAAYNLAVLLEATGEFQEALEFYDRALSLGGKDYYANARAGCATRLQADQSLR